MDLRSDYPYWLLRHGIIHTYPSLRHNITTDIAVIGGGISGALVAWYLSDSGRNITLVDRRHIGMGSTAASTSLLQYEIDVPLFKLAKKTGKKNAIRSYLLCRDAISGIETICSKLKAKNSFERKASFQFASYIKHVKDLEKEFSIRRKIGIAVEWMDEKSISDKYGFSKPGGILSKDGAGADAYQLTHSILERCIDHGLQVYDHTEIVSINHRKKNVELVTADNKKIVARKLVIACGYESQRYIPRQVQQLHSTYAIVSEPCDQKEFWYRDSLIWETRSPYLYVRTTKDHRIITGGKDIPSSDPIKRDSLLKSKARSLEKEFAQLFPHIPFKTDFKWAGTFGSTKDGLPYIGSIPQRPNTYFALGLGGNGITFSQVAAQIISDIIAGKKNNDAEIFSFDR